ncbi:1-phosphofructokinase [Anaerosinus massiliensis]|uniref:1-phosphofructokinase n=1 Tax=Massilibacillus massiliensis TaxID=1806837 RepID=UPI000B18A69F|nr:1-phosphofructokinase [Massilibacillus massiliensis]
MIYTVTFNPSLDYIVKLDTFTPGAVNRTKTEMIYCGGKGINVSIVLKNLGFTSKALGFIAGFTGQEVKKRLQQLGCESDFIELDQGLSRINVKIKAEAESEINGQGPFIDAIALQALFTKLDHLSAGDILVLAGSIPSTLPNDIYEKIMAKLMKKDVHIIVDATCSLLLNVLKYKPFLIKPNHHELGEMFGVTLNNDEEIITYAKKLQDLGAQNVLISMAGDGAILLTNKQDVYKSQAPKGKVINSVGAGDSMVAGFLAGYLDSGDLQKAFKMGIATGSASAFSEELATKAEVEKLFNALL